MNYGTIIDNQLHPAPRAFMLHGAMVTNPKAEHFAALNEERAMYGLPQYSFVDATPPPPRTFSKLRIVAALTTAGVWDSVKQLLIERGLYDLFLAAQNFAEDNEYFENGKAALQTALGWTDEQVEAVLDASVI